MCSKQNQELVCQGRIQDPTIYDKYSDYTPQYISHLIKRYQELRSFVEITSTSYGRLSVSGAKSDKEELLCSLVDINEAVKQLAPGQQIVIRMLQKGCKEEEISTNFGISLSTVKTHMRRGIQKLADYLSVQEERRIRL